MYYKTEPTPAFSEKPDFKVPSNWTPPIRDAPLELYISEIEDILLNINESSKSYPNFNKDERKALHSLIYDDQIIIKTTDKGSAVVVWCKDDYLLEASNHLKDTIVYQKCKGDPLKKVNNEVKSVLRDMFNRKKINNKVWVYLIMKKPELGRFYLLPKIHKRALNVPGRPVISNNGTATENKSAFLDFHLKNIVSTTPHILEDTRDFLQRLNQIGDIPENALLVSFDVVGLYPHKPHDQGVKIMWRFLDKREDQSVSSESLCKLPNIVLKHNYFELGKGFYQQILGTAIGTKFALHYANIFMAGLENETFEKSHVQPDLWLRYLDIFCIWTEGLENSKEFFGFFNNFHRSIKFTMEYSQKQINFIDVLISKNENESSLVTSLFTKSTDSYQYLHATSCHRSIYKKSIPYGQAIRMKRICSNEVDIQRN